MARSGDPTHMRGSSAAAAVQHGNPLGKLVSRGSPSKCTVFMGTESVPFFIAMV